MATTITLSATGSNDHTAINTAITNATAGDTLFLNNGIYDIAGQITVNKALTTEGQSQSGTILLSGISVGATPLIAITANDCTVKNFTLDGNGANTSNEVQGIYIAKVNNYNNTDVTIKNCRGHQHMLYGVKTATITRLTTIRDSNVGTGTSHGCDNDTSGYTGISITRDGGIGASVTAVIAGHNIVAGDYITVTTASDTDYNGSWLVDSVVASTSVSFTLAGDPGGNATGAEIGRNNKNISYVDCTFSNPGATTQSFKVESSNNFTVSGCSFATEVAIGDNITTTNVGATFDDCDFDAVAIVNLRTSTFSPTITNSRFTRDGGTIVIGSDAGANIVLTDNTFNGRNKYVGYNYSTLAWTSPTAITETGSQHIGYAGLGKTTFASYNSTGSHYNTSPYAVPDTACNSLRTLVQNTGLDETNIHYALLSNVGDHAPAESNIAFQNVIQTIEGYPDRAVVDMTSLTSDWLNTILCPPGTVIRKLHLKNGDLAAQQALRFSEAAAADVGCSVEDCVFSGNTGVTSPIVEVRTAGAGVTTTVKLLNCTFDTIAGSANGLCAYVQGGAGVGALTLEGCRIIDCAGTGTAIVRSATAGCTLNINGCEFINNSITNGAPINIATVSNTVNNCTFYGNTGLSNANSLTTSQALTINNCITAASTDFAGAGVKTVANCLIGGGIGSLTDGGGNITGSPTYVDSANDDYGLTASSLGVGTGTQWWTATNARPVGYNGEPFPDLKIDIGANQSTHDPMHPANL